MASKLEEIRAARAELLLELRGLTTEQGAWRPDGRWSLQHVVEHLVLAERGGFDLIWRAAEAFRAGTPVWVGESENAGVVIEDIVARTWKPRETAPPSAEPTGSGSLAQWMAHLESCDALLRHLPAHVEGLPLERVIYPHFLCGPLDALQRLDFIRFHMQHHLPQVERIKSALPGGAR
jgi:hypothetical protein